MDNVQSSAMTKSLVKERVRKDVVLPDETTSRIGE